MLFRSNTLKSAGLAARMYTNDSDYLPQAEWLGGGNMMRWVRQLGSYSGVVSAQGTIAYDIADMQKHPVFACPSESTLDRIYGITNYAWNIWLGGLADPNTMYYLNEAQLHSPSATVMLYDSPMPTTTTLEDLYWKNMYYHSNGAAAALALVPERHGKNSNVLFADGHVELGSRASLHNENIDPLQ